MNTYELKCPECGKIFIIDDTAFVTIEESTIFVRCPHCGYHLTSWSIQDVIEHYNI